jgi:hypothetical protein
MSGEGCNYFGEDQLVDIAGELADVPAASTEAIFTSINHFMSSAFYAFKSIQG